MKYFITAIIMMLAIGLLLNGAITKNEQIECDKLKQLEQTQSNFYWTDWQLEMCNNK